MNLFLKLCFSFYLSVLQHTVYVDGEDDKYININGTFIIGAMVPIHTIGSLGKCGKEINDQIGIQNLEALLFSRDLVNQNILKDINISIGLMVYDTCGSETVALDGALQFVKLQTSFLGIESMFYCNDGSLPNKLHRGKLIGVIGAATSSVSIQLANFLRLFKVPQVSYSATSPELSDTSRYEYFLRTVASDKYQAKAIVEILRTFSWNYIVVIYEETSYGQKGYEEIRNYTEMYGICIGKAFPVTRYYQDSYTLLAEAGNIVNASLKFNNTAGKVVVVLFASEDIARAIFTLVNERRLENKFVWVGSDAWTGRKMDPDIEHVPASAIGVQPKIEEIKEFDTYFEGLTPQKNLHNPWFTEYWEQVFSCTYSPQTPFRDTKTQYCNGSEMLSEQEGIYRKYKNTYGIMDAVYAFAYALKSLHYDYCGETHTVCPAMANIEADNLWPYLLNVSFRDVADVDFKFTGNSGPARYSVMQYVKGNNGFTWKEVDYIEDSDLASNNTNWFNKLDALAVQYQPSNCSSPCKKGEATLKSSSCCWTCSACKSHQYLKVDNQTCLDCPMGTRANSSYTGCKEIPETTMDMSNVWAITTIILTCIGVIVTSLVAGIFCWQRKTPIIMASGKELSFVLLFGILLSYFSTFVFVAYPTAVSCGVTRLLLGMSFTVCYAAILVKTNRIYRVFNINTSKPKKVKFISAKSQLLITSAIVFVELIAIIAWLIFDPPKESFEYPTRLDKVRVCEDAEDFAYLGALLYPFTLMIFCIYYAVRTRKTPDGFNETRYITFGSYSFCVLWIAFISIYFSVHNNTIRVVSLCFASTINATVTLITLFITKTYIVIFRPLKNTRENVMARRRTHTYESVDISNLANLSRMASAVSTWHSVTTHRFDSEDSQSTHANNKPQFNKGLSISVISMNNVGRSEDSVYSNISAVSAPPLHCKLTNEEIAALSAPFKQSATDLGDERLKQFLEKCEESHVDDYDDDNDNVDGIGRSVPRRSLRTFRSRRRRRTVKRARSLDRIHDVNLPKIIITPSSQEDNSKRVTRL